MGDININQKSIFMEPRLALNLISSCLIFLVQELKGTSPLNNNSGAYDIGIVTVESVLVVWDFSQQKSSIQLREGGPLVFKCDYGQHPVEDSWVYAHEFQGCSPFRLASLLQGKSQPLPASEQDFPHPHCISVAMNGLMKFCQNRLPSRGLPWWPHTFSPSKWTERYRDCIFQNE